MQLMQLFQLLAEHKDKNANALSSLLTFERAFGNFRKRSETFGRFIHSDNQAVLEICPVGPRQDVLVPHINTNKDFCTSS